MNFKCFVIFLFLLLTKCSIAQQVPALMTMPVKYIEAPDGDVLPDSKLNPSKQAWIVFSDRDKNKAFDKPAVGTPINTVNFLDKFFVTGESGDFLELYKWADGIKKEDEGKRMQLNPKRAVRVGWMKKEYLLLWITSIKNKATGFSEKGFIVLNAKNVSNLGFRANSNSIKVYQGPVLQNENIDAPKNFQVHYVYKRTGNKLLIGRVIKSNVHRVEKDIIGWIDESQFQLWKGRLYLEPNWNSEAVSSRKSAGISASLFADKKEALAWKNGNKIQAIPIWDKDPFEQRGPAHIKRFPIFESDENTVHTGFFTSLFVHKDSNNTDLLLERDNKNKNAINVIGNLRKINIVFVIDAGFGIGNHANAIKLAVKKLIEDRMEKSGTGESRNIYKYGAVVYRSNEDKICPGGNLSLNKSSLTADATSLISFLNEEFDQEGCSKNELNKNVNNGMLEALQLIEEANRFGNQTNFIISIGGATGDNDAVMETIPALMAKNDVNLLSFQMHNDSAEAFKKFNTNFIQTLNSASQIKYKNTDPNFKFTSSGLKSIQSNNITSYSLDFPTTSAVKGVVTFPKINDSISSDLLCEHLKKEFSDFDKDFESSIAMIKSATKGIDDKKNYVINPVVKKYLQKISVIINDSIFFNKSWNKYEAFFIPAWTSIHISNLSYPVFKRGIYIFEDELFDMITKFEKIQIEAPPAEAREMMYEAYRLLVLTYFGDGEHSNNSLISKLTLDNIVSKVSGLFTQSPILKQIKISDLRDSSKVSDEKITQLQIHFIQSLEKLKMVSKDVNGSMRDFTEHGVYYWIPEDYLP